MVEWPGKHDWGYGPQGPPQGGIDVAPGVHALDYYNAYVARDGGWPPVLACLAVKGGAFDNFTMLMENNTFFRPTLPAHIVSYDLQGAGASAPPLAFAWNFRTQSPLSYELPTLGLVSLQLDAISPPAGTVNWSFDDGATAQGASVTHVFPRPGLRTVRVEVKDGDRTVATLTRTIAVHLSWSPITSREPQLDNAQAADLAARDPATLPATDLASVFAVLGAFHRTDDVLRLAPAMSAKMKDVSDADLPYVRDAALRLVRDDRHHFAEQEQLLQALIDRTATAPAGGTPPLAQIANQSRLRLAQILVKTTDRTDDVRKLIDAIDAKALTGEEPRSLDILRGDLALAQGDVDGARRQYQRLTGDPQGVDARSSVRRTAKISQARAFMDRKDFDAAEDALREVSWQAPVEKLSPDWALERLRLYEAEGLPGPALLWARRLLPVITAGGRSELLYRLTELGFEQNDADLAHKSLSELLKKHPYSDEAARAKEKWPAAE
ncbi:MAG: PKD domain-containing protein [Verrucomicrobiota bacterium]